MAADKRPHVSPLLVVERLLLVLALAALGWYATARVTAVVYQASQNRELNALREAQKGRDVQLPAEGAPRTVPRRPLVGRIEVPRLRLSAIVRSGADDRTLARAVGHIAETALPGEPGNVALAGHRDTFFRPLKGIRSGDRIVVTTPEGEFAYVVRETRVVPPTDVSVLDPTPRPTLTLVTCHPFDFVGHAPNRFIVRAEQAEEAAAPASVSTVQPLAAPSPAAAVAATAVQARSPAVAERPRELRKVSVRKPARATARTTVTKAKAKASGTKVKPTGPRAKGAAAKKKKSTRNPFRAFLRLFH